MARTIGRVDFKVDFDGKGLPAQARKIGSEVGDQMGGAATSRFGDQFSRIAQRLLPEMNKNGELFGFSIGDAMERKIKEKLAGASEDLADAFLTPRGLDEFADKVGGADNAVKRLRGSLNDLRDTNNISMERFDGFNLSLDRWASTARKTSNDTDEVSFSLERLVKKTNEASESNDKTGRSFGRMSTNAKQWTAIIAAVLSGFSQLNTLAAAAASGIVTIGGAAFAGLLGLGTLAVAVSGVSNQLDILKQRNELAKTPIDQLTEAQRAQLDVLNQQVAALPGYVATLDSLGGVFGRLRDSISSNLFSALEGSLTNLLAQLPLLQGGLDTFASSVGTSLGGVLDGLFDTESITIFNGVLATAAPIFASLAAAIDPFAEALGRVFIIGGPTIQRFADGIADIANRFSEWTKSVEGEKAIQRFFEDGERILGAFNGVLGSAGDLLANLVTPETIDRAVTFLDNVSQLLPALEPLLSALGEVDIFNVLVEILDSVLTALKPVIDLLGPVLAVSLQQISTGFEIFSNILGIILLPILGPLTVAFNLIQTALQFLQPYIDVVTGAFDQANQIFSDVITRIIDGVKPAFEDLLTSITGVLPGPEQLSTIINDQVIPALQDIADWIVDTVVPALTSFFDWIGDVIESLGGFDGIKAKAEKVLDFARGVKSAIDTFLAPALVVVNAMIAAIRVLNGLPARPPAVTSRGGGGSSPSGANSGGGRAAGGFMNSRQTYTVGEAGREIVIPLQRAIGNIDPSARALATLLQGKSTSTASASAGTTVMPGAIQVVGYANPQNAGAAMAESLVRALA